MASVGDIIPLLSSKIIPPGGTLNTSAVVLGQYNSLTVTIKSDGDYQLDVLWSDNGDDYDFIESYTVAASVGVSGVQEFLVVGNKWAKYTLTLTGGAPTYFRMTTYGVTTNNNTQSILVPQAGSKISSLNIANLPRGVQGLLTAEYKNFKAYNLRGWQSGDSASFISSDQDMRAISSGAIGNIVTVVNNGVFVRCEGTTTVGQYSIVHDNYLTRIPSGVQASLQWSCDIDNTAGAKLRSMVGYGSLDLAASVLVRDGIFIGGSTVGVVDTIVLSYIHNGTVLDIPQANWNVDKFNGTSNEASSLILNIAETNAYRVDVMRGVFLVFSILDSDGIYKPAHIISLRVKNVIPAWSNPAVGLMGVNYHHTAGGYVGSNGPSFFAGNQMFDTLAEAIPSYTSGNLTELLSYTAGGGNGGLVVINNNATSLLAFESSLVNVIGFSATARGNLGAGIFSFSLRINPTVVGGVVTPANPYTTTTIKYGVIGSLNSNTKEVGLFHFMTGTSYYLDLTPYNIWLRGGETIGVLLTYEAGSTPTPTDLAASLLVQEFR